MARTVEQLVPFHALKNADKWYRLARFWMMLVIFFSFLFGAPLGSTNETFVFVYVVGAVATDVVRFPSIQRVLPLAFLRRIRTFVQSQVQRGVTVSCIHWVDIFFEGKRKVTAALRL